MPSTTTVYLQNSEIFHFYDLRRIQELLLDDGSTPTQTDISDPTTTPGAQLYQIILWASSDIDTKCQQGLRYNRADLELIVQNAISPPIGSTAQQIEIYNKRAAQLRKLTADLTYGILMSRRGFSADKMRELAPQYEEALGRLQELYDGRRVFDLDANTGAGVPNAAKLARRRINSSQFNQMFGLWPAANTHRGYGYEYYGGC